MRLEKGEAGPELHGVNGQILDPGFQFLHRDVDGIFYGAFFKFIRIPDIHKIDRRWIGFHDLVKPVQVDGSFHFAGFHRNGDAPAFN